jgi:NADPH:quinone reductase-like Zn-dependent oxidoreductase
MKAAIYDHYGPAEVVTWRELAEPRPRSNEVLVRVEAAALNPKDVVLRGGKFRAFSGTSFPKQLGLDLAGRVVALGWRVPTAFAAARVFGFFSGLRAIHGSLSELTAIPADHVAPIPNQIDAVHAAAIPLAGSTALQALRDDARLHEGERLLIVGASGGVGTLAVQIAKIMGAHVVATASARNFELVRALGADELVDHAAEDVLARGPFDVVLDCYGKLRAKRVAPALRRPQGRFVSLVPSRGIVSDMLLGRVRFPPTQLTSVKPRSADLAQLATWLAAGRLKPVIDEIYPPERLHDAMRHLETHHARGKIVVRVR